MFKHQYLVTMMILGMSSISYGVPDPIRSPNQPFYTNDYPNTNSLSNVGNENAQLPTDSTMVVTSHTIKPAGSFIVDPGPSTPLSAFCQSIGDMNCQNEPAAARVCPKDYKPIIRGTIVGPNNSSNTCAIANSVLVLKTPKCWTRGNSNVAVDPNVKNFSYFFDIEQAYIEYESSCPSGRYGAVKYTYQISCVPLSSGEAPAPQCEFFDFYNR